MSEIRIFGDFGRYLQTVALNRLVHRLSVYLVLTHYYSAKQVFAAKSERVG